jgi:hypothetical protein
MRIASPGAATWRLHPRVSRRLLVVKIRRPRAAADGRRWSVRRAGGWAAAVLGVAGTGLVTALALQPDLPYDRVAAARAALRRARVELRDPADLGLARAAQRAETLEQELARAENSLFRYGRVEPVAGLAAEVETLARRALAERREAERQRLEATAGRLTALAGRLDGLGAMLPSFPADRAMRRHYLRSRLELDRTRAALAGRDPAAAESALAGLSFHVDALAGRFDDQTARLSDPGWLRRWQRWVDQTVAETAAGGLAVIVEKASGRCFLVRRGRVVATFAAELGRGGLAGKLHSGDGATPEGRYRVVEKRDHRQTRYYRALMLDYPNDDDRRSYDRARRQGTIPRGRGIGGLIEIHGEGGRGTNWTDGCVALANRDMDRVFAATSLGTPVTIVGRAKIPGVAPTRAPALAR